MECAQRAYACFAIACEGLSIAHRRSIYKVELCFNALALSVGREPCDKLALSYDVDASCLSDDAIG